MSWRTEASIVDPKNGPCKFLFDENLSPRLVGLLATTFPGSTHVRDVGLAQADDVTVPEAVIPKLALNEVKGLARNLVVSAAERE